VTLAITSDVSLRYELRSTNAKPASRPVQGLLAQEDEREEENAYSGIAAALCAAARLALVEHYKRSAKGDHKSMEAPILAPFVGLFLYTNVSTSLGDSFFCLSVC
jgi:hypothetical protein